MTTLRKLFLAAFAALYIGVAPLTVLYALGYIFNPADQKLFQTGLVSLASDPPGAEVWVDDELSRAKTPVVLRDLKPGRHEIRVALGTRPPWRKQVKVIPERVLQFENILLFPDTPLPEILGNFPVSRLWHVPGGKRIFVLQGNTASGLSLFDPAEKKFRPLIFPRAVSEARVSDFLIHSEGDQALLILQKEGTPISLLIRFSETPVTRPLTHLFSPPVKEIRWDRRHSHLLFYLREKTLRKVDLESRRISPPLTRGVSGYAIHKGKLYVLDRRNRFFTLNAKGKLEDLLLDDPLKARLVFGEETGGNYQIAFLPNPSVFLSPREAVVIFLSGAGRLSSNKLPYFLDKDVEEFVPAHSHPRAAYRRGKELWIVDFERDEGEEEPFFETGPTPHRIFKGSDRLSELRWIYNDQYLVFREGNRVKVVDIEGGLAVELLRVSEETPDIALDSQNGYLYFSEPGENRLARIRLHTPPGFLPRLMDDFVETSKESP